MKTFFYTLFFITISSIATAQQPPIMVCSPDGNTCTPHLTLNQAYLAANSGDYIYLPGGGFELDSIIKKEIHLIGAGFNTTSSPVTGTTTIFNNITIAGGLGDNSSFEGFYLNGALNTVDSGLYNLKLSRLSLSDLTGNINNSEIRECVIRDGHLLNLTGFYYGSNGVEFTGNDNIILNSFLKGIKGISNCFISNCIIGTMTFSIYSLNYNESYSFVGVNNLTVQNSFYFSNVNSTISTFLNNSTDGKTYPANVAHYDPTLDYHVIAGSSADNAGTDGTDIGIYGGAAPWKEGSVPSNPHIFFKQISPTTNTGNLPVHIKVSAEE